METTGQVYSYYFTREYCPQIVLLILWALALLLIPVQLMLNRSHKVQRHCITQFLIENVFRIMLNKHIDRDGKEVCTILNYRVPDRYKVLMLAMVLTLMGVAWVLFWDIFLFQETHSCSTDPDLACFPAYPNMTTPRLDCSDTSYLEVNKITSVICYRFVYRLGLATGAAFGEVTTITMINVTITLLLLKVSNGSGWNKHRAVLTVAIQIITVAIAVSAAIAIYVVDRSTSSVEIQAIRIVRDSSVTYTVIYRTVLFPWWSFKDMKDNENEEDCYIEEQDKTRSIGILATL